MGELSPVVKLEVRDEDISVIGEHEPPIAPFQPRPHQPLQYPSYNSHLQLSSYFARGSSAGSVEYADLGRESVGPVASRTLQPPEDASFEFDFQNFDQSHFRQVSTVPEWISMSANPSMGDIGKLLLEVGRKLGFERRSFCHPSVAQLAATPYGNTILGRLTQSADANTAINEMNAFVQLVAENLPPGSNAPHQASRPRPS